MAATYTTPPLTSNTLTPAQRTRLQRSSNKIARMLGSTPHLLDPTPSPAHAYVAGQAMADIRGRISTPKRIGSGVRGDEKPKLNISLPIGRPSVSSTLTTPLDNARTPSPLTPSSTRSSTPSSASSVLVTPTSAFPYHRSSPLPSPLSNPVMLTAKPTNRNVKKAPSTLDAFRAYHPLNRPPLLRVASPTGSPSTEHPYPSRVHRSRGYTLTAPINEKELVRDSYLDATPSFVVLSEAAERRLKLERVRKRLGEGVPLSLVFRMPTGAATPRLHQDYEEDDEASVYLEDGDVVDLTLSDAEFELSSFSSSDNDISDSASYQPPTILDDDVSQWFDDDDVDEAQIVYLPANANRLSSELVSPTTPIFATHAAPAPAPAQSPKRVRRKPSPSMDLSGVDVTLETLGVDIVVQPPTPCHDIFPSALTADLVVQPRYSHSHSHSPSPSMDSTSGGGFKVRRKPVRYEAGSSHSHSLPSPSRLSASPSPAPSPSPSPSPSLTTTAPPPPSAFSPPKTDNTPSTSTTPGALTLARISECSLEYFPPTASPPSISSSASASSVHSPRTHERLERRVSGPRPLAPSVSVSVSGHSRSVSSASASSRMTATSMGGGGRRSVPRRGDSRALWSQ